MTAFEIELTNNSNVKKKPWILLSVKSKMDVRLAENG